MSAIGITETVIPILSELGIFAIGATVVGWVAKDAIGQYFEKELQRYQADVDKELNRFQAELEKDKLRFSELHNERAKITAELYERFVEFENDMKSLTTPLEYEGEPSKDEKIEQAAESGNEFINYYIKNKIYFPPEICDTVEELQGELKSVFDEFRIYQPYKNRRGSPEDLDKWTDAWETVTEDEVQELKEDLEEHFRELLGVEIDHGD